MSCPLLVSDHLGNRSVREIVTLIGFFVYDPTYLLILTEMTLPIPSTAMVMIPFRLSHECNLTEKSKMDN